MPEQPPPPPGPTDPALESINAGRLAPGDVITLVGERFGAEQGRSRVVIAGVRAAVTRWTDRDIDAFVPDVEPGPVTVRVVRDAGTPVASNEIRFRVADPPASPPIANPVVTPLPDPLAVRFDGALSVSPDLLPRSGSTLAGPGLTTTWDFGDGSRPDARAGGRQRFRTAGTYTVTLTVRDRRGRVGTARVPVTVGGAGACRATVRTRRPASFRRPRAIGVTVRLPGRAAFNFGSSEPGSGRTFRTVVRDVATLARRSQRTDIQVFTDPRGARATGYNQQLAQERATTLATSVRHEAPRARVQAVGRGNRAAPGVQGAQGLERDAIVVTFRIPGVGCGGG